MSESKVESGKETKAGLRRELGVWSAVSIVVGTVIGSGIFIVPNTMTQRVGSVPMVFVVWVVGGLLSLAGALSYAELSAAMPGTGGEYVYLGAAYGPFWSFIYGWTQMWVGKSGSIATLATAFFLYFGYFFPQVNYRVATIPLPLGDHGAPLGISLGQLLGMVLILGLAGINFFGVKVGGDVQVVVTICKVGLIAFVIAFGLFSGIGTASNLTSSIPVAGGFLGFFAAMRGALWAYDGWNNVSMVASEVKEPQRNLPRALIFGTLFVMTIYLLANLAYFLVLPASAVAKSSLVAADMMRAILGDRGAQAVSLAAMISIFAALNGSILSGSRVPYAMADDGYFFAPIARVNPHYHTPGTSILALSCWASLLVLSGRYDQLFTYVIFANWMLYGMTAVSVLVLRHKRPDMPRPYRTAGYPVVPVLFVLSALALVISTLIDSPRESGMGIVLIALGLPFYWYWSKRRIIREQ
jgi:basic amino acid/polyamine antiporter, APA family